MSVVSSSFASSFFDVVVISCPDASAARACVGGTLQDIVRYLNNESTATTTATTTTTSGVEGSGYLLEGEDVDPCLLAVTQDGRTVLGATYDPNGKKCGSGGGTIACYEYAQHIYSKATAKSSNVSSTNIRVLIIHGGGHSSRCPTQMVLGKAWTTLLSHNSNHQVKITSPAIQIIQLMQKLFFSSHMNDNNDKHYNSYLPPGSVVVTSGDALITLFPSSSAASLDHLHSQLLEQQLLQHPKAVIGLAVPAPLSVATNHGVFIIDENTTNTTTTTTTDVSISPVYKYLQKPSLQDMEGLTNPTSAWIDTGIVIFLPQAAQVLRQLGGLDSSAATTAMLHPPLLQYCTRSGLQQLDTTTTTTNGTTTNIPIDLYSHIMLALATTDTSNTTTTSSSCMKKEKYGSILGYYSDATWTLLLSKLYDIFNTLQFHVITCPKGQFTHLGTTRELLTFFTGHNNNNNNENNSKDTPNTVADPLRPRRATSFLNPKDVTVTIDPSTVIINALVTTNSATTTPLHQDILATTIPLPRSITVGSHCVLEHCHFNMLYPQQHLNIGNYCLLSGLRAEFVSPSAPPNSYGISSGMMVQQVPLKMKWRTLTTTNNINNSSLFSTASSLEEEEEEFAIVILHVDDPIQTLASTIYGINLQQFLTWTSTALTEQDIWPDEEGVVAAPRTLWNARIHPIVTKKGHGQPTVQMNFSTVIGWISNLMKRQQQQTQAYSSNPTTTEEDHYMVHNIKAWKDMERVSLAQICKISDAYAEYTSREKLSAKIRSTYDECIQQIFQNIQLRTSFYPNNTAPFIESFLGGDISPFQLLYHRLLDDNKNNGSNQMRKGKQQKIDYDNLSRAFMVLAGTLNDVAEKLGIFCGPTMQVSDEEPCTPSIQRTVEQTLERIRMSYDCYPPQYNIVKDACKSLHTIVYQYLLDGLQCQKLCDVLKILTTCANYLEIGASALTEVCLCASIQVSVKRVTSPAPLNKWVLATSPGRVDIAGGFSDLPPIFYEHGGSVVGVAMAVDGVKPLSARCRRRHGTEGLHLVSEARSLEDGSLLYRYETHVTTLQDLIDYRDLNSGACLLKASLLCLGVVPLSAIHDDAEKLKKPIKPYLDEFFGFCDDNGNGKGFGSSSMVELVSTSLLPRGSGMGSSSLLGACVLTAICRCAGVKLFSSNQGSETTTTTSLTEEETLTYAVLALEQIMHSGGGYQDQTNIIGGVKIARATAGKIPIEIKIERLEFNQVKELNERLVLVFSGTPRVAKNLLSSVLRRWSKHTADVVSTMNQLVCRAEEAAAAILSSSSSQEEEEGVGLIEQLGRFMLEYREQKKIMIGDGAEPRQITELINVLQRDQAICGAILLGAGGGGFLALIASKGLKGMDLKNIAEREASQKVKHQQMMMGNREESMAKMDTTAGSNNNASCGILENCTWHSCTVCEEGLKVGIIASEADFENDHFLLDWQKPGMVLL